MNNTLFITTEIKWDGKWWNWCVAPFSNQALKRSLKQMKSMSANGKPTRVKVHKIS